MLKKRLVGVVTIKGGWAVQSVGYRRYLPLGKPECLVENLDRWGADEILLQVIDRSVSGLNPDFELLGRIARLGLETPLIYGGGIHSVEDGVRAIQGGADRLVLDSMLHDAPTTIRNLSERLGAQALIAALPLSWNDNQIEWMDYRQGTSSAISREMLSLAGTGAVSEILIIDWKHEGLQGGFEPRLVSEFPLDEVPLIVFGGISDSSQMAGLLQMKNVSAVAAGNFLNYREHTIQRWKEELVTMPLRPPVYESKNY
ncbi:MAG: HisA/HisF-related TIM barrel protein [Halothiobacillaceae bacterium]|nr:HisA/HisF-related TIM barrel protein [Halothiobacillaceae bacterium]